MSQQTQVTRRAAAFDVDRRLRVAGILQEALIDLVDLSLQGTQARWNLRGPNFRALRFLLDDVVDAARTASDRVAERCLALGVPADARPALVASESHLDEWPGGRISDHHVVDLMVSRLEATSEAGRSHLGEVGELDPVSENVMVEALDTTEKHLWMLNAHRQADPAEGA